MGALRGVCDVNVSSRCGVTVERRSSRCGVTVERRADRYGASVGHVNLLLATSLLPGAGTRAGVVLYVHVYVGRPFLSRRVDINVCTGAQFFLRPCKL